MKRSTPSRRAVRVRAMAVDVDVAAAGAAAVAVAVAVAVALAAAVALSSGKAVVGGVVVFAVGLEFDLVCVVGWETGSG